MDFEKIGFDMSIVRALNDIDNIPTTEPGVVPGIPGRLFIVAPEQVEQLEIIISTLCAIPESDLHAMSNAEKIELSSLLNNAIRVRNNSISRKRRE